MTYKAKLLTGMIATLALMAGVAIGLQVYWYEHAGVPRWGHGITFIYMLLSMFVVVIALIFSARHEQIEKRRKQQDTHGR